MDYKVINSLATMVGRNENGVQVTGTVRWLSGFVGGGSAA